VHHLEGVLLLCHKHYGTNRSFGLEVPLSSGSSNLTRMAALEIFFKYPYIRFNRFKSPILGAALNRDMVIVGCQIFQGKQHIVNNQSHLLT
jgi:hypothetical protein